MVSLDVDRVQLVNVTKTVKKMRIAKQRKNETSEYIIEKGHGLKMNINVIQRDISTS